MNANLETGQAGGRDHNISSRAMIEERLNPLDGLVLPSKKPNAPLSALSTELQVLSHQPKQNDSHQSGLAQQSIDINPNRWVFTLRSVTDCVVTVGMTIVPLVAAGSSWPLVLGAATTLTMFYTVKCWMARAQAREKSADVLAGAHSLRKPSLQLQGS